jgi:cytochrome b pre-mRNA-processing protein 3
MLRFLFPRLTTASPPGMKLFRAVTDEARSAHWYVEGAVPDTLDGRFAMLTTLAAMLLVRLEREGEQGASLSVAFTEQFVETMESEHREMGLGDPKLGRTVRKLVGSLGRRVELWRSAVTGETEWDGALRDSLYKAPPADGALAHSGSRLRRFWAAIDGTDLATLIDGRLP